MRFFVYILVILCTKIVHGQQYQYRDLVNDIAPNYLFQLSAPFNTIESPGFANYIKEVSKSGWYFESPYNFSVIVLSFDVMDLNEDSRCSVDNVAMYAQYKDGEDWSVAGSINGICGKTSLSQTHVAKRLLLKYRTTDVGQPGGFKGSVTTTSTAIPPEIQCIRIYENDQDSCSADNATLIVENETITIDCEQTDSSTTTITWNRVVSVERVMLINSTNSNSTNVTLVNSTYFETQLQSIDPYIVKNHFFNGSIQLHQLRMEDTGTYRCIARNQYGTATKDFPLIVKEKCLCPWRISSSWYPIPPYTKYYSGVGMYNGAFFDHYRGIFYDILPKLFKDVCKGCSQQNATNGPIIEWNDRQNNRKTISTVKNNILDGTADIYFPIDGTKYMEKYFGRYYFIPIVQSPGAVFFVKLDKERSSNVMMDAITRSWPIIILTYLLATSAGIIFWMCDTYWNEEELPRSFRKGAVEGVWWAFITMTTVGYGDVAPRGVLGRCFAVLWIMFGLVIVALFTSSMTTALTASVMTTSLKVYGTTVGVLADSPERRLAVVKNANVKVYSNMLQMRYALLTGDVSGVLVDSYAAAHFKSFNEFRINNLMESENRVYGMVLGSRLTSPEIYSKMMDFVEDRKMDIVQDIVRNVKTLKSTERSDAVEKSMDFFNHNGTTFKNAVNYTIFMLILFAISGFLLEYLYLRPRARFMECAKSKELLETWATINKVDEVKNIKVNLLHDLAELKQRFRERMESLKFRHKVQEKMLQIGKTGLPNDPNQTTSKM